MNHTLVVNLALATIIAMLGAIYTFFTLGSFWWALFAYSSAGMIAFLLFTLISVYIDRSEN